MTLILPINGSFIEPFPPQNFQFEAKASRIRYPILAEKRGNSIYWYLRKQINGRRISEYIAKQGGLSLALLENAVKHVEFQAGVQS